MPEASLSKTAAVISWICQIAAAVILLQTLYFKFTGAAESIYIFEQIGMEPVGRYASGCVELIASLLLLTRRWSWLGAGLALSVMIAAIGSHLFVFGVEVMDDEGTLFALALIVATCCSVVLTLRREVLLDWLQHLKKRLLSR